ncbi:MAG TPA: redox-regulated ATPase YchF [Solirubrobacterales bacterium]|nr:redox-regulated ATPase YchF [Solirubrobacterales bacterium]
MKIGIVGMPNAGKSTLFNALTAAGAEIGDYPFTTLEPNVAVVRVPDERLERVAETVGSSETVPETIDFYDIAGLVKGASQGEGLGNQFLASIRETDAICHVIRAHGSGAVAHPEGRIDPVADAELIEAELLAADLEGAERRLERVTKLARSGEVEAIAERDWLERVVAAISAGRPAREVPVPEAAPDALRMLAPLTAKPVLYVVNVDEGETKAPPELVAHAEQMEAGVVVISARVESELRELDPEEAEEMRGELGVEGSGLERLIRAAFELLDLVTFFTADPGSEARARTLPRGGTAYDAAGRVHGDIQRAFVRAEVIAWDELVDAGGYAAARERGTLRIEGRDYVVREGDVIHIRT